MQALHRLSVVSTVSVKKYDMFLVFHKSIFIPYMQTCYLSLSELCRSKMTEVKERVVVILFTVSQAQIWCAYVCGSVLGAQREILLRCSKIYH